MWLKLTHVPVCFTQRVVNSGANPSQPRRNGRTFPRALDRGYDVTLVTDMCVPFHRDVFKHFRTKDVDKRLEVALTALEFERAERIVTVGADPNHLMRNGQTALIRCVCVVAPTARGCGWPNATCRLLPAACSTTSVLSSDS